MPPITADKIHIEVSLKRKKLIGNQTELQNRLTKYITEFSAAKNDLNLISYSLIPPVLFDDVDNITIDGSRKLITEKTELVYHFYLLHQRSAEIEMLESDDCDETPASNHWILPNKEFHGLWESLLYEDGIKENILQFAETLSIFGKHEINKNIISCNRIILLHGPPGTGKTSLCKAIAQKISIRLNSIYKFTHFVEINSHSLFSKWFSESGKLVQQLFIRIKEMIMQPNVLVCVLIDEIESIAYDRSSISGQEPKDSLRVVNAVLTQLDQIKMYPNVLILSTSNLTSTIDLAFIDRVDIKQYIGLPSTNAIYEIYLTALKELIRVELIKHDKNLLPFRNLIQIENGKIDEDSLKLLEISKLSNGMSGRTLRKIPFLAYALYSQGKINGVKINDFLEAMAEAVKQHTKNKNYLNNN